LHQRIFGVNIRAAQVGQVIHCPVVVIAGLHRIDGKPEHSAFPDIPDIPDAVDFPGQATARTSLRTWERFIDLIRVIALSQV